MSENTQNNRNPSENEKKENRQGNGGQGHRNRHRPHHRGPRKEHQPVNTAQTPAAENTAPKAAEEAGRNQKSRPNNNHGNQNHQGGHHNNQRRGNRGRDDGERKESNQSRSNPRYSREKRPYSPYEAPDKEEIALSELRAQIVLHAADGSVPTAYGASQSAEEAVPVVAAAEEALPMMPAPETEHADVPERKKTEVVGVRFRSAGKMYYFDPNGVKVRKGESVIVETTRGPEFGDVCLGNSMVALGENFSVLRPVLRIATQEDIAHNAENREKEKEALVVCQEKIRVHKLDMKLIDVQYAFDNSKLLFYFSAEGRVDFRELVKDLASVFRTRIELRQIGIRDEAKMLGGIGACGRTLCCSTFLPDFAQVSIKMAKEQNLSLNSAKISGVCGRLMCCLRYESEVYSEEIRKTPSYDSLVRTEDGIGTVIGSNPLAGTVRVVLKDSPDTAPKQYHRDNVTVLPKERKSEKNTEKNDSSSKKG